MVHVVPNVYAAPELVDRISREDPPTGAVALWWLGQASFVLRAAGVNVYIDPYLAVSASRLSPPPFAPAAATNADVVILTHNHLDHVDPDTLPELAAASPRARFIAPRPIRGVVGSLVGDSDRVVDAVADQPLSLDVCGTHIEVLPVPAKHEEFDLTDDGYPYLGYSIRIDGVCVHHSGDTIPYEGHLERVQPHKVDVALLPINGRDFYRTRVGTIGNFNYREAGDFAAAIGARVVVPIHYGMFQGNTVPPGEFISYLHQYHPEQSAQVMGQFGKYVYIR